MCLLHLTVFLGAFLLFPVELIVAKALLPSFGGSYLVWSVSVMFFQGVLLTGYAFARYLDRMFSRRWMYLGFLALACLPLFLLPLDSSDLNTRDAAVRFVPRIITLLVLSIGPFFFVLSAISVVSQRLLGDSRLPQHDNPYVLYATSNLGSFSGLLSYPLLVERMLNIDAQLMLWSWSYAGLVALYGLALCFVGRGTALAPQARKHGKRQGSFRQRVEWFSLAAATSALFLAVTNVITFDLAAIPLLWILPLSIYLLSFVLTFKRRPWYPKALRSRFPLALAIGAFLFVLLIQSYVLPAFVMLGMHLLVLFVICVICHGELNERKPAVDDLGVFYLVIALGGFCGSMLVSWVTPLLSDTILEYGLALLLASWAFGLRERKQWRDLAGMSKALLAVPLLAVWFFLLSGLEDFATTVVSTGAGLALAFLCYWLRSHQAGITLFMGLVVVFAQGADAFRLNQHVVYKKRNFYGIYRVYDQDEKRYLKHGTTLHGSEYLDPALAGEALAYFHAETPSGELLSSPLFSFGKTGLIGLGAGSLAVYARPGSTFDIYELDPDNEFVAREYFSFLDHSPGNVRIIPGDARMSLANVEDGTYSTFIVDAFNSDSIPIHLLTLEALEEYFRCLKPDGILLMHISNKYLELKPVLHANGNALGKHVLVKLLARKTHPDSQPCEWLVMTDNSDTALVLKQQLAWEELAAGPQVTVRPWTDRYSNILSALK